MVRRRARRPGSLHSLWLAGILLAAPGCGASPEKPLHVVLIVVDTLRADHLSTYGYRRPTSPELDKLAREGVVFERAVSQGSWTVPSMVSMMTGAYIAEELIKIPPEETTLAQVFQKGGYATGAFIYNNVLSIDSGFNAGFDLFDFQDAPYGPIAKIAAWISANRGRKSFTYIHLNESHEPYDPPDEFDRFVNEKDSISTERMEYYRAVARDLRLSDLEKSVRHINDQVGGYDDDVCYSDAHIGQIVAALRANGEWDRTAIVVAADHGEGLWTRPLYMTGSRLNAKQKGDPPTLSNTLHMTHGTQVNLELVHVPLIVVAPGMRPGVRVQPWVENIDIAPTLLELCDLPAPPGLQGQSLLPLWSQPEVVAHQKRGSFSHTRFVSTFIDQNGYQLILPTPLGECQFDLVPELYDLRVDPEARFNLAESSPEIVAGLKNEIASRIRIGLNAYQVPTAGQLRNMNALGYVTQGVVNALGAMLAQLSVDDLIKELSNPENTNCLVRYEVLRALGERALSDDQKAAIRKLGETETSKTIKTMIEGLLSKI